ncbi:phospholipase D-like domain-containing protein [Tenacibaculum finnmarkense genomovar ulcerans]|uniref:helicase-related protein n=1 Tax=Tenacibaculum finnmarkense TaxID=2781243 RepID=UPI001E2C09E3|nr:helicase-related protein [Tenacibaculum finnmarkense]MCD8428670.1 phospholipase D-like domain-containing protein [Tenacibaculum finnmarkense genomovar ulcerans]MCG8732463.1 restriction endonuclease subunit R [Tenacibaculum finnmarkense]
MSTKFFTNKADNSLLKKFEGVFKNLPNIHNFDALVGYFRATGYFKLRPFLNEIPEIRILVGINVDTLIQKYHSLGQQYLKDPKETKDKFIESLKVDIEKADYNKEIEEGIIQFISDITNGKIQIKAHPEKNLHAKIYIFKPKEFNEYSTGSVITGSSNLTEPGLGSRDKSNYEFNVELRDYDDIRFATEEFEMLWAESVDILPADISSLEKETYLNDEFTPFELYMKLLIEYFGQRIEYDPTNIDLLLPEKYKKLTYQSEAAIEGYEKLMRYNGFFLADVVGLGKTIVASIIAKKFIYENGYHSKILIVYPPALEENWKTTIKDFHIENSTSFVTTGSLHKVLDGKNLNYPNPNEYDLIIIDEAHKFRNDTSNMYEKLQTITKTDRRIPGSNGDTRKKIMLLSATPLNNHPADIENQIYLFQDKRNATLPSVKDLQAFFTPLKDEYDDLKKEKVLNIPKVKAIFDKIRDKVIEPLVIRRTRTDIETNADFSKDIKAQGIVFPKINPPNAVRYEFDDQLSQLFDVTISMITSMDENRNPTDGFGFYRYRAIEFLIDEEDRKRYGDVMSISNRLAAIMKTLLVKRLESSFYAFKKSINRLNQNTQHMINMFEDDKVFVAPDVDVNKYLNEGNEEGLEEKIHDKGGNNQIYKSEDFKEGFLDLLLEDKKKIQQLVNEWSKIEYDPKLEKFLFDLSREFLNKKKNHSNKLVIFSESKETIDYLEDKLKEAGVKKILAISATNRKEKQKTLQLNFDANQDKKDWENEFDIVLTTEVLAEGINLHRSNVIINYDVPWNSTRLMQRIGRVNRLGTEADEIHVFNFYPSDKSDNQIKLTNTAIKKLQAFHSAFGEDSQIYSQLEEVGEAGLYGSKLKEEINETLVFLQELRDFKKKNINTFNRIKNIPKKSRIARKPKNVDSFINVDDASITYIKSAGHPGVFYKTDSNSIVHELTFVNAAKIFKANLKEKSTKLPSNHHEQVNQALVHFTTVAKIIETKNVTKAQLSSTEKKVIGQLEFFIGVVEDEFIKKQMQRALDEIYKGSHRQLPNQLAKFFKTNTENDPQKVVYNVFNEVLKKMNFSDASRIKQQRISLFSNPQIVISESFIDA